MKDLLTVEFLAIAFIVLAGISFWVLGYVCKLYPFYSEPVEKIFFSKEIKKTKSQVSVKYTPAETRTSTSFFYSPATKTPMPQTMTHTIPAKYLVMFNLEGQGPLSQQQINDETLFHLLKGQDLVEVFYREGFNSSQVVVKLDLVMVEVNSKQYFLKRD